MIEAIALWIVVVATGAGALVSFYRTGALAALASTFYLMILLLVRPLIFILGLDTALEAQRFDSVLSFSAIALCAGMAWIGVLFVSFHVLRRPAGAIGRHVLPVASAAPNRIVLAVACLLLTGLALGSTAYLARQQGSVAAFMYAVKIGKDLTGSYWVRQICILAGVVCLYGLLSSARDEQRPGKRAIRRLPLRSLLFFGGLIALNLATNYLWGNRMNIALLLFSAGLGIHLYVRPFRLRELVLAGLLAAAFLNGLGLLRQSFMAEATGAQNRTSVSEIDVRDVSNSLHFVEFDGLMLALHDAGHMFAFRYGQDFYNGLVSWIPRSIMPGRETFQIGAWMRQVYDPSKINGWPVTVVGAWYVNFGVLGILMGAILSGLCLALVDGAYRRIRDHPWHVTMGPTCGFFIFAGGVDTGAPQHIVAFIVPLALFALAMKGFSPRRREEALDPDFAITPQP